MEIKDFEVEQWMNLWENEVHPQRRRDVRVLRCPSTSSSC